MDPINTTSYQAWYEPVLRRCSCQSSSKFWSKNGLRSDIRASNSENFFREYICSNNKSATLNGCCITADHQEKKFDVAYVIAKEHVPFRKMKLMCELEERYGVDWAGQLESKYVKQWRGGLLATKHSHVKLMQVI